MKTHNEYSRLFPDYATTPKAVIAAIAMSLAARMDGRDIEEVGSLISQEWYILNENDIVPQRPRKYKAIAASKKGVK